MLENGNFGGDWSFWRILVFLGYLGNDQNLTLELISVHQTIMWGPNNGLNELESNRSYLNIVNNCFLVPVMGTKREVWQKTFYLCINSGAATTVGFTFGPLLVILSGRAISIVEYHRTLYVIDCSFFSYGDPLEISRTGPMFTFVNRRSSLSPIPLSHSYRYNYLQEKTR